MASGAAGEPLAYRHAVVLYSAQTTQGTAVTPATAVGNAMVTANYRSGNQSFRGPGSPNRLSVRGGSVYSDWTARFEGLNTGAKAFLQRAVRASGVVPWTTVGFGWKDDLGSPTRDADQVQDCKLGQMRLRLDCSNGHAPLGAEFSGVGGLRTTLTTLDPATLSTTPWMSYDGVFTRAGSAFPLRMFELELDHNLSRDHVIPGAAPSTFHRGWSFLTEHNEVITGRVSRYAKSGVAIQAQNLTTFAMQLVLTNAVDSTVLTLALAGVDFDEEQVEEDQNGVFYSYPFQANTLTVS